MFFSIAEERSESMKKRISITACRYAILITERGYEPGIPLEIGVEEQRITDIEIRGGRWYSRDHRLTRGQQEKLTQRALAIIDSDQQPRLAPKISIRDCQKAIAIAGGIRISLRRKERLITEVTTRGGREFPMVRRMSSVYVNRAATSNQCGEKHHRRESQDKTVITAAVRRTGLVGNQRCGSI